MLAAVDDLGPPIAYDVLESGVAVLSREGRRIGTVRHVLADDPSDIFDGLVIDTRMGPGGHRFVDSEQVDSIHERGVVLSLDEEACERLPEPSANPAAVRADPAWGDELDERLTDKLRRAWDLVSGNY
jgi:hypothetical protein